MLLKTLLPYIIIAILIVSVVGVISLTVKIDSTLPDLHIKIPTSSQTYVTNLNSISIGGNASDDIGVVRGEWKNLDTEESGDITGTVSWSQGWSVSGIDLTEGANRITVKVWDAAGNAKSASLKIILDTLEPYCTIKLPTRASSYHTNSTTVDLSGTGSDNTAIVSVEWINEANSVIGTAIGTTSWSIDDLPLSLGYNDVTVRVRDAAGNFASARINISSDLTSPTCAITTPTAGATFYTNAVNINLGGTASDNMGIKNVNWTNTATGISREATGTTSWTIIALKLNAGNNDIIVTAWDACGNNNSDTITVNYDSTDPTITVTTPASSKIFTTAATINLAGTASDNEGIASVQWENDDYGTFGTAVGTTSWTVTGVALAPERNYINVTAFDLAGNWKKSTLTVIYDLNASSCSIVLPTRASTYWTQLSSINLSGIACDNYSISSVVWSNAATGGSGTATGTTSWSIAGIALNAGDNLITVTAFDFAGRSGSDSITVNRDNAVPACVITTPTASATYTTGFYNIIVGGTATDNTMVVNVTWNNSLGGSGGAYLTPQFGGASITWQSRGPVLLTAGDNVITVTARDSANNSATSAITITYDPTDPTCAITSPTTGANYLTNASTIDLSGTASDSIGVVTVNWTSSTTGASGTATGTDSWTITGIELNVGDNHITVKAWDTAGNFGYCVLNVTRDSTKPVCTITTPTTDNNLTTVIPTIDLGGAASDGFGVTSVTWYNSATGASGTATGTTSWSINGIALNPGNNLITVIAWDAAGNAGVDQIRVTYL